MYSLATGAQQSVEDNRDHTDLYARLTLGTIGYKPNTRLAYSIHPNHNRLTIM